ncbi:hypothetical protein JTB14_015479 [Gonioctena quinquepunctata]|nr:hypothetical protein JTB14_015479 [Gonioctena quinquepunctata]
MSSWNIPEHYSNDEPVLTSSESLNEGGSQHWFQTLVNTVKKYKRGIFGDDSRTHIKRQRMIDYTVPPNYKFVLAKYTDGFYRPASIMGRSKKLQVFIVFFYQPQTCSYVKPRDVILKHGNLLDRRVCFCHEGQRWKATVFGNNSPANHGFPSIFYLKKKSRWFKVCFRNIFLTKKQVNRMYFTKLRKRTSNTSTCTNRSNGDSSQ